MNTILLVEDCEDEVLFFTHAVKKSGTDWSVQVAMDGQQAVNYISGTGLYADRRFFPLPSLVLLDLKLPRLNGLEVLHWIRRRSRLRRLPVIMLTNSNHRKDMDRAYDLGVNSYCVKPSDQNGLEEIIESINKYWFKFYDFSPSPASALVNNGI